eukprot:5397767-Amphidinium_carterae.1
MRIIVLATEDFATLNMSSPISSALVPSSHEGTAADLEAESRVAVSPKNRTATFRTVCWALDERCGNILLK